MKHQKLAMFLVFLVVMFGFLDFLTTLPVIDRSDVAEHNPFFKTSSQLLTFGVPLQVFLSIGFFIFYYELWVKNWLEKEHPKAEFAFLTGLFFIFVFRFACVANNANNLFQMWMAGVI